MDWRGNERVVQYPLKHLKKYGLFAILGVLMCIGNCFIPNKDTLYAIATSQVGEQVLSTPLAAKAEKALEAWLDKQIATP